MKKISVFLCFLLFLLVNKIHAAEESTPNLRLQISILTCAPGEDMYTVWGHTAIRVVDSSFQTDLIYNYGSFDFNEPNFLLKFIKGNLRYFLSVENFQDFLIAYQSEGRSIKEQVLALSPSEKLKWFQALQLNNTRENRFYLYNFITDNCTTRIKDGLFKYTLQHRNSIKVNSYRSYIVTAPYQQGIPWIGLGIDLLLGGISDEMPSPFQAAFLPELLYEQINLNSHQIKSTEKYTFTTKEFTPSIDPMVYLLVILLVYALSHFGGKKNIMINVSKILDMLLLVIFGLAGTLLVYMSLYSNHTACHNNYNVFWLHPIYLIALIVYFKAPLWAGYFGRVLFSLNLGVLLFSYWIPQYFSLPVYTLMLIALLLNYRLIIKGLNAKKI